MTVCHHGPMYKPIATFPAYRVSDEGYIESRWRTGPFHDGLRVADRWKRMRHNERPDGYLGVELRDGHGRRRRTYVHILVAEAFIGPKPFPKACVRHIDGSPGNNRADNLAWGTYSENESDKRRHGTWESRRVGRLTEEQRTEVIAKAAAGERPRDLAEEYGVSRPTITRLLNGSTWRP